MMCKFLLVVELSYCFDGSAVTSMHVCFPFPQKNIRRIKRKTFKTIPKSIPIPSPRQMYKTSYVPITLLVLNNPFAHMHLRYKGPLISWQLSHSKCCSCDFISCRDSSFHSSHWWFSKIKILNKKICERFS